MQKEKKYYMVSSLVKGSFIGYYTGYNIHDFELLRDRIKEVGFQLKIVSGKLLNIQLGNKQVFCGAFIYVYADNVDYFCRKYFTISKLLESETGVVLIGCVLDGKIYTKDRMENIVKNFLIIHKMVLFTLWYISFKKILLLSYGNLYFLNEIFKIVNKKKNGNN